MEALNEGEEQLTRTKRDREILYENKFDIQQTIEHQRPPDAATLNKQ